ncbi:exported hypothetical protein [Citricoccus sp. K5]|nr:exported hypothetical protein [Citricoccus sp. K5]
MGSPVAHRCSCVAFGAAACTGAPCSVCCPQAQDAAFTMSVPRVRICVLVHPVGIDRRSQLSNSRRIVIGHDMDGPCRYEKDGGGKDSVDR